MTTDVKVRMSSFATGFGLAMGCLVAMVVFFLGGCLLMVGSCFTAVDTAVRSVPPSTPPTATVPDKGLDEDPAAEEQLIAGLSEFEVLSEWDSDNRQAHRKTIYVPRPTKANVATHIQSLIEQNEDKWLQFDYYDNKDAAPRLRTGTPIYYPDSSQPHHVANFVFNPSTGHKELLFRSDIPAGEEVMGQEESLVIGSETMASWEDEVDDAESVGTTLPTEDSDKQSGQKEETEKLKREADDADRKAAEQAKLRTWTSSDGRFTTRAKLISYANAVVTLEKANRTRIKVPVTKLSQADRKFIDEWRRNRSQNDSSDVGDKNALNTSATSQVQVIRARLVPIRTATGVQTKAVFVDWKNNGSTPVRAVDAKISLLDERGKPIAGGTVDYTVFAVSDSSPGVLPEATYVEPKDKGFIVDPAISERAKRVEVEVTTVLESGAY